MSFMRRNANPLFLCALLFLIGYCLGGKVGIGIAGILILIAQFA